MLQEFYEANEWLTLPLITLCFFFSFFIAVLIWVIFGMRDPRRVQRMAELPFTSESETLSQRESPHG